MLGCMFYRLDIRPLPFSHEEVDVGCIRRRLSIVYFWCHSVQGASIRRSVVGEPAGHVATAAIGGGSYSVVCKHINQRAERPSGPA